MRRPPRLLPTARGLRFPTGHMDSTTSLVARESGGKPDPVRRSHPA